MLFSISRVCSLSLLVALCWVMFGPAGSDAQRTTPQAPQYTVADDEMFIVYRDADGRYACRAANKAERDRINRHSFSGRTRLIYNGASREKAKALSLPADSTAMPALQTSAGLRIVLHGTNALNSNPEAKNAFIVAANRWEAMIATPITVVIDVDFGTTFFGDPYDDPWCPRHWFLIFKSQPVTGFRGSHSREADLQRS